MNKQLLHLDLFSGIGGFALAAQWAGFKTVGFSEINPSCNRILKKHFPDVFNYGDIKTITGQDIGKVDIITGGFPCQPFSTASAGKRKGTADDRYLWPEMRRVISECKPTWICGENVAGINGMALNEVVSDMEALGFKVQPFNIPACALGFDHRRARYWFLAHSNSNSQSSGTINEKTPVMPGGGSIAGNMGKTDGVSGRMDKLRGLGNAIVPQIAYEIFKAINQSYL